jgi:hypothetical protein
MAKVNTVEQARHIVNLSGEVNYLVEKLTRYSNGKRLDGSRWDISNLGDGRHSDMQWMLEKLPPEEVEEINRYIVKKFKKHIREGKKTLAEMNVQV